MNAKNESIYDREVWLKKPRMFYLMFKKTFISFVW